MKKEIYAGALLLSTMAGAAQAQSCENAWSFGLDGGFEGNVPEAYSPCGAAHSVGVLCIGPALMVRYTPPQGALATDPNGGEYWPITMTVGDFTYTDHVNFMGATGEFSFLRVAWDSSHPLFEALQSGASIEVSMPSFNLNGSVSLSGSRAAISQVIDACQGN